MPALAYPHLFKPRTIRNVLLKNRITMAPLYLGYAAEGGMVSPLMLEHYRRMAAGGAAMVVVENAAIHPSGSAGGRVLRCDHSRYRKGLSRLAEIIRSQSCRAVLQINHAGRFANTADPVSASSVDAFGRTPRTLSRKEIKAERDRFARAALRVKQAGFDMVELHGGTGYLLAQFASPRTNRRADDYGGSLQARLRFPLEVLGAVQDAVGDFPVGYRFLADEWLPDGLHLEESKVLAAELADAGVAYLSVMGGTYESFFLPDVVKRSRRPGYMTPLANAIKKEVRVPVIAAGRISTPKLAESILRGGRADLIGLARMLWVDPLWPTKARRGEDGAILRCNPKCNACMERVMKGKPAFCPQWDKETRASYRKMFR
jgi:2,4-dienoyl-CoA reductase (NADPH2)